MKDNQNQKNQSSEVSSVIRIEILFPGTENTIGNHTAFLVELAQSINQAVYLAGDELDHRSITNLTYLNNALQRKISTSVSEMSDKISQFQNS